jgi:hypothetical protein
MNFKSRSAYVICALALAGIGATQIRQIIKIVGVGAAVQKFGPDINKAVNKLSGHTDTMTAATKVVPIISGGIGGRTAIGAAQVTGPRSAVDRVNAVAQIDQDLFGHEIKIRAMIPVTSKGVISDLHAVPGVGISGIVDLKL